MTGAAADPAGGVTHECGCRACRRACGRKPGWFLPGEAERAADLLGMTLPGLFSVHLAVDWYEGGGAGDIFVLAPAVVGGEPGAEYGADPEGRCVFLAEDGRCKIYAARPYECRTYIHDGQREGRHRWVADRWRERQDQIVALLGREPESEPYYSDGPFGSWL